MDSVAFKLCVLNLAYESRANDETLLCFDNFDFASWCWWGPSVPGPDCGRRGLGAHSLAALVHTPVSAVTRPAVQRPSDPVGAHGHGPDRVGPTVRVTGPHAGLPQCGRGHRPGCRRPEPGLARMMVARTVTAGSFSLRTSARRRSAVSRVTVTVRVRVTAAA